MAKLIKVPCPRCNGTGEHLYNQLYGRMCFQCKGSGYIMRTQAQIDRENKRKAAEKEKIAAEAERSKVNQVLSNRLLALLQRHYADDPRNVRLASVPSEYHDTHRVEWFKLELRNRGVKKIPNLYADLLPHAEEMIA